MKQWTISREGTKGNPQRLHAEHEREGIVTKCQDQEGVLAWVSERLAVAMRQAEDLILRDFIVSAASQINAGGGSNGDNPTNLGMSDFSLVATTLDTNNAKMLGVIKPWVIDLELLAA